MALMKTLVVKDVTIKNCYIKVDVVISNKTEAKASVAYQATKESEGFGGVDVTFPINLDGGNPIAQAYDYLKTLPEFAGAVDC